MFSTFFILCLGLLAVTRPSESQRRGGPRVVTEPENFDTDAGTSITLPCFIRNVGRRSVFWFKGDAPEGRELIMQMKSVRGEFTVPRQYQDIIDSGKLTTEDSNLIINDLQASDSDTYTCSIAWARQSVTHTLTVVGGEPEMFVTAVPSDGHVSVGEGLPASLSCTASGNLPTTISWFKEGDPNVLSVGSVFNVFDSSREDSGRYICRAENGVFEPVSAHFDLDVEFVEVTAEATEVVVSGEDLVALLSCRISGYPEPQVAWYTSTGPVTEDGRHQTYVRDDVNFLEISDLTSLDLGEFQCYGYNDKSRDHATITVTAAPGLVTVTDVSQSSGNRYRVTWEANSLAAIRFYHLALREGNSDDVRSMSVEAGYAPVDGKILYHGNTEVDLTPGQTYEFMVKAVGEDHQPGPDQDEPYIFNVPYDSYGADVAPTYAAEVVGPVFVQRVPDVKVPVGGDAYLTCTVDHLERNTISWISQVDDELLSVGDEVYTSNPNVRVSFDGRSTSTLYISPVQELDQGHYMCQVSSDPPLTQTVTLRVGDSSYPVETTDGDASPSPPTSSDSISNEDAWKWWKLTMTLLSRLPQAARIMQ